MGVGIYRTQLGDKKQFAYFNLLKFLGACCIAVFVHFHGQFLSFLSIENPFKGFSYILSVLGYCFVEMFFILSGILFAFVYQPRIVEGLTLKDFMLKRIGKFFPLAFLTSCVAYIGANILTYYGFDAWGDCGLKHFLYDGLFLTLIINTKQYLNGPIWYLTVLLICYVIGFFLTKMRVPIFCYFAIIFLGLSIQHFKLSFLFFHDGTSRGLIAFFIGVLMKPLFMYFQTLAKDEKIILKIFIAFLLPFYTAIYKKYGVILPTNFAAFCFFPLLIFVLCDIRWLNNLCDTKFVKWLGAISYDIYLWNFPIYIFLHVLIIKGYINFDISNLGLFLGFVFGLHILIATLSHRYIKMGKVEK